MNELETKLAELSEKLLSTRNEMRKLLDYNQTVEKRYLFGLAECAREAEKAAMAYVFFKMDP